MSVRTRTPVTQLPDSSTDGDPAAGPEEPDLPCRDLVELVTDYLDGALEPAVAAAVQRHLELCPPCVEYVRQMRQTARLLGDFPAERLTEQAELQLLTAFRGFRPPASRDRAPARPDDQ